MNKLLNKIKKKEAKVIVIGLGYVGLPLACEIAKAGFNVIGIDKDNSKVKAINKGKNYISDMVDSELINIIGTEKLIATQDFKKVKEVDVIILSVPTPLTKNQEPDMRFINKALDEMLPFIHKKQLIILESTTYPGTTEELIRPQLESRGFEIGQDLYLAFSPERIDPGNKKYKVRDIPKIVGGVTKNCTKVAETFYMQVIKGGVHTVSSPKVAEMEKLLENIFRNVNIALVNEFAMLCHKMGIDIWEVIKAASTKPYGFMPFYPGPGVGGHCIPVDPYYLSWKAKEYNFHTKFIELAGEINNNMPQYVVDRIIDLLNRKGKSLSQSTLLLLGIAYKKDISDIRESPAVKVAEILKQKGTNFSYHDPFVPKIKIDGETLHSVNLNTKVIHSSDITIILTAHSNINYKMIHKEAKVVLDTCNILRDFPPRSGESDEIYRL